LSFSDHYPKYFLTFAVAISESAGNLIPLLLTPRDKSLRLNIYPFAPDFSLLFLSALRNFHCNKPSVGVSEKFAEWSISRPRSKVGATDCVSLPDPKGQTEESLRQEHFDCRIFQAKTPNCVHPRNPRCAWRNISLPLILNRP
jgi:hypothetical protein